jgi:hypothetical protein
MGYDNLYLYEGRGKPLGQVQSVTGNQPTLSVDRLSIASGAYTELFAAHDCLTFMLEFIFSAAATGNMTIERLADASAAVVGETFTVVSVSASRASGFTPNISMNGYFRVKNNSGQVALIFLQKRLR